MEDTKFLTALTSVRPSERQLIWQQLEYYNFIHFGMNTITGAEWGSGKTPPSDFTLRHADCRQWVSVLKASGSRGVIFTAKHHDGFCLFPSQYTDYSIKNSPYKDGKGDIVKELADACREQGLKFGIYLSPWDRHEKSYGTDAYNDFFCKQLEEVLTNYGELFEVWFDGACGEGENGKKQIYDFPRYYALVRKLQPNAVIAICGPDVRWIGNEGGKTRKEEWSVVPARVQQVDFTAQLSQQAESQKMDASLQSETEDLGSRKALQNETDLIWYPAECDISITRRTWFHAKWKEVFLTRSLKNLITVYYNTVGGNSSLLLNVPPDKNGVIPDKFTKLLKRFGKRIANDFSRPVKSAFRYEGEKDGEYVYSVFAEEGGITKINLYEDIAYSQRIESFSVAAFDERGKRKNVYSGTVIGLSLIHI